MEQLNQESSVSRGVLKRLRESILRPRTVFVLASALSVIIFVAIFAGTIIEKRQFSSQENSQESLAGYNLNGESGDLLTDLGTSIEEYFL